MTFKVVVLCGYGEKRTYVRLYKESETEFLRLGGAPGEKCHRVALSDGILQLSWWEQIENEIIVTEAGYSSGALWTKQDTWTHMDYMTCL